MSSSTPNKEEHKLKEKEAEKAETKGAHGGEPLPNELKGGHAPAEKIAGGVRIARRERNHSGAREGSTSPTAKAEGEEGGEEGGAQADDTDVARQSTNVLAGTGLAAQTKLDYPEEAVKSFHEKKSIHPQHQAPPPRDVKAHSHRDQHGIQFQPR